jgi:hypothetical protein
LPLSSISRTTTVSASARVAPYTPLLLVTECPSHLPSSAFILSLLPL